MLPMSNTNVEPGVTETQQMRIIAPVGVSPFFLLCVENFFKYVSIFLRALYDYDCASVILLLDRPFRIKSTFQVFLQD